MEEQRVSVSVIIPALNEEGALEKTVSGARARMEAARVDWEIVLVDDGSVDRTGAVCDGLGRGQPRIKVVHHSRRQGIGRCIRDGIALASKDCVTWIPADGENDPGAIVDCLPLLERVDMVVPYVVNTRVRGAGRRFLSRLFRVCVNRAFGTRFRYTNGTVIYRRQVFADFTVRSDGFFFQAESLVKAARRGRTFREVPVEIRAREAGCSKAVSISSLLCVIRDFYRVFAELRMGIREKGERT